MKRKYAIIWMDSTDSTNNEIIRKADTLDNLSVVAAVEQTAGRGQRGNSWKSARGENLTFSILLKFGDGALPSLAAGEQFRLSCVTTLALLSFLKENGIETLVKWPNDIYAGDRKICGMLIENSLKGQQMHTSTIGIGLNVNETVFPEYLPNPVSMASITGRKYDTKQLLEEFLGCFDEKLDLAFSENGSARLMNDYTSRMYRRGTFAAYRDKADGSIFEGKINGVRPSGTLIMEKRDGSSRDYAFKEIEFIIA